MRSPWELPLLAILFNGYALVTELHRNTPATRAVVFDIALAVALMVFSLLCMVASSFWRAIRELWDDSIKDYKHILLLDESVNKQAEVVDRHTDLLQQLADLGNQQAVDLNTTVKAVLAIPAVAKPEKSPEPEDR
jgi:hypothetical protein